MGPVSTGFDFHKNVQGLNNTLGALYLAALVVFPCMEYRRFRLFSIARLVENDEALQNLSSVLLRCHGLSRSTHTPSLSYTNHNALQHKSSVLRKALKGNEIEILEHNPPSERGSNKINTLSRSDVSSDPSSPPWKSQWQIRQKLQGARM